VIYGRHSVLKRGCSIWDKGQMPEEEFHGRLDSLRREMRQRGLDALVIYGDTWSYADLCYLTNHFPKVRGALGIISTEGPVFLLLNIGGRDVPFARSLTWVQDLRPSAQVGRDGAAALRDLGLERARIGLVDTGKGLPLPQFKALKEGLPEVQWEDSSSVVLKMRLRKSERELAIMREAGRILKEIWEESKEIIRPGRSDYEIVAGLDRLARLKGVEDVRILIGERRLQPPEGKKVDHGQSHLALYLAIQHRRYWVETGKTCILENNPNISELYETSKSTLGAMAAALKPGMSAAEIFQIARRELAELYPGAMTYGLGNGIGLSQWEPPFFDEGPKPEGKAAASEPATVERDMVLALRVALQAQGIVVLAGHSYQVSPDAPKTLTQ